MKKILALVVVLAMVFVMGAAAFAADRPYIGIVSKGFQHQFWQTVAMGSQDAANEYGVDILFVGPPSEADVAIQIDMINAELAKNLTAMALAVLDTESVTEQLLAAKERGIPIIGFDSGVPGAPEGTILSTASTDNEAAGALGAERMFAIPAVRAAIEAATPENPVVIGALSQDATSASVVGRTVGFLGKMWELASSVKPDEVAITGHVRYELPADSGNASVIQNIVVPASPVNTDVHIAAQGLLQTNPLGIFCSNEGAVTGLLAATSDGQDLDKENGAYKDLIAIGFDAGETQKTAVRNGWFYGSVTQDPYMIGYLAVELAMKAINGETLDEIVDTGAQFYTAENMDDEKIAPLLYD
ncbi:MAG: substrate-binding domain-containing protein [Oscillospiraceae bacterium]|nr:substrate-binding domain-containing protein [Oscillospiraceae bacterium]